MNYFRTAYYFSTFVTILILGCNFNEVQELDKQKKSLTENVGEKFKLVDILDSAGNKVELNFRNSKFTIIDFWNNSCPPCITEMKQFPELLRGREQMVSVISISVNQFWLWKSTLSLHTGRFTFLKNNALNWSHYTLQSNQNPKLKNEFSIDRIEELGIKYNISTFPAYFVLDKEGIIQSRPESAVEFIKQLN